MKPLHYGVYQNKIHDRILTRNDSEDFVVFVLETESNSEETSETAVNQEERQINEEEPMDQN